MNFMSLDELDFLGPALVPKGVRFGSTGSLEVERDPVGFGPSLGLC